MKRLSLVVLVMIVAAALVRLAVHSLGAEPPPNFNLSDPPRSLPEIAFEDGAGAPRTLSDFRGKFVLLNIWATWCIPCRKEMPTLDRLQAKLGSPDFEVVALSIDRKGPDVVRKFYADVGIRNLAVNIDAKAEATSALATVGVPTTLLIDRQGQEIGRLIGPAVWDSPEMIDFLKATIAQKAGQLLSAPTQEKPS
jgi:thiol-disulfide isomerase/thioredoxin